MADKRQMIIDRLWIMKKAALEINALTENCTQNCWQQFNRKKCPLLQIGGGIHCCHIPKIADMYIPK